MNLSPWVLLLFINTGETTAVYSFPDEFATQDSCVAYAKYVMEKAEGKTFEFPGKLLCAQESGYLPSKKEVQ